MARTLEDLLFDLGNIPLSRILLTPPPGKATWHDAVRRHVVCGQLCEVVDGVLVVKASGFRESILTTFLNCELLKYLDSHPLGIVIVPSAMFRLFSDTIRSASIAFVNRARFPGRRIPKEPIPAIVPNFVIEVLRADNTYGEMSRKRREYFHAGVELVWMVDPRQRTIAVYTSSLEVSVVREGEKLNAGKVLPGFEIDVGLLFGSLNQQMDAVGNPS